MNLYLKKDQFFNSIPDDNQELDDSETELKIIKINEQQKRKKYLFIYYISIKLCSD